MSGVDEQVLTSDVLLEPGGVGVWAVPVDFDDEHLVGVGEIDLEGVVPDVISWWNTGCGPPMRSECLGENDLGVRVARLELERSLVEDLPQHSRSGTASARDCLERRADLRDRDVSLSQPLLERTRDQPRAGDRPEVDERPGSCGDRNRPGERDVVGNEIDTPVEHDVAQAEVMFERMGDLDHLAFESIDTPPGGGGSMRYGAPFAGGEGGCQQLLLMGLSNATKRYTSGCTRSHTPC